MKEFIDKLIERLEEKQKQINETNEGTWFKLGFDVAFEIVNRYVEEYNLDLDKVKQEPKTRIERIRSMSAEELADAILEKSEISTAIDFCQCFEQCYEDIQESECKKCLIKYLNSPEQQKAKIPTEHFHERFSKVI